jgi:hypothetical protein
MMNLKETINFNILKEKGLRSVDISNNEVIRLVTSNADSKVIY